MTREKYKYISQTNKLSIMIGRGLQHLHNFAYEKCLLILLNIERFDISLSQELFWSEHVLYTFFSHEQFDIYFSRIENRQNRGNQTALFSLRVKTARLFIQFDCNTIS